MATNIRKQLLVAAAGAVLIVTATSPALALGAHGSVTPPNRDACSIPMPKATKATVTSSNKIAWNSAMSVSQVLSNFEECVNQPRSAYPWLRTRYERENLLDCARGVMYMTGIAQATKANWDLINVSQLKSMAVKNGTWKTKPSATSFPQPGDIVVMHWPDKNGYNPPTDTDHVGIVISATSKWVTYVSADSSAPIPAEVNKHRRTTINSKMSYGPITGWGKVVNYKVFTPPKFAS